MSKAQTRQFWTKIHRWMGLTALAFLFIAGVTGCFLCFDKRIDAALNSDLFYRPAGQGMAPWTVATRLQAERPDLVVTAFPLNPKADQNLRIEVQAREPDTPLGYNEVFVDPADGHVVGTRQIASGWDRRHIVEAIFQLHQNVLAGTIGRWLMGIAALLWLISNFVGLYLTFPAKKPFWPKWKKKFKIDTRAKTRRLMLEIHNASGLWLLIGASVLAYTSVAMNFFNEAFTPAVQAVSPARPSMFDIPAPATTAKSVRLDFEQALQRGIAVAKADKLTWRPAVERFNPDYGVYGITFTDNGVENYHRLGPVTYYIDASDGHFVESDDPYHDSFGRKLSRSLYPLHSGDVAGGFGIAIIFLLGLATAEMCVTGFYTWWKKRESKKPVRRVASPKQA